MSKEDKKELRQQIACEWLQENYLQFGNLRHDVVGDRLQIRVTDLEGDEAMGREGNEAIGRGGDEGMGCWRNLTDKDINTMVCQCVAESGVNISVTEMWTALKSDMVPSVHPLRAWLNALRPYTPDQPDWIDLVAQQVRVRNSAQDMGRGNAAMGRSQSELWDGTECLLDNNPIPNSPQDVQYPIAKRPIPNSPQGVQYPIAERPIPNSPQGVQYPIAKRPIPNSPQGVQYPIAKRPIPNSPQGVPYPIAKRPIPNSPQGVQYPIAKRPIPNSLKEASSDNNVGALWRTCFKKWFVAMVASWMKDDVVNHTVLVLVGRQGIYKTTWLDHLIPPELRAYSSKLPLTGQITKDDRLRLCENGLLNIDELDAICGREMNIVKSLLTSTDINERAAYGRLKERRVRLASFCASTNNREFLTDITGNRRWLPFEVEEIQNPFYTTLPYELMYAQAKALVEQGWFEYWFDMEAIEELEMHNELFRAQENEEQLLPILFDVPAEGKGEFMTTAEISERLVSYGNIKKPMSTRRLGTLMGKMNFPKGQIRISGTCVRGWYVYKRENEERVNVKKLASSDALMQRCDVF